MASHSKSTDEIGAINKRQPRDGNDNNAAGQQQPPEQPVVVNGRIVRTLLSLNDDCLSAIMEYLSDVELSEIASTCSRLKTVARDVFARRAEGRFSCNLEDCEIYRDYTSEQLRMLRNFGDKIKEVKIIFDSKGVNALKWNTSILNLLLTYCTGPIDSLSFTFSEFVNHPEVAKDAPLFMNVKNVELVEHDRLFAHHFSNSENLEQIIIRGTDYANLLVYNFPKLKTLAWWYYNANTLPSDETALNDFFLRHDELENIHFCHFRDYDFTAINSLHHLKEVHITMDQPGSPTLTKLYKITALTWNVDTFSEAYAIKFLNNFAAAETLTKLNMVFKRSLNAAEVLRALGRVENLEVLHLSGLCDLEDDALEHLHDLNKLQDLKIECMKLTNCDRLTKMLASLDRLEKLCIKLQRKCGFDIDIPAYRRMIEIYRERDIKFKLIIRHDIAPPAPFEGEQNNEIVEYRSE